MREKGIRVDERQGVPPEDGVCAGERDLLVHDGDGAAVGRGLDVAEVAGVPLLIRGSAVRLSSGVEVGPAAHAPVLEGEDSLPWLASSRNRAACDRCRGVKQGAMRGRRAPWCRRAGGCGIRDRQGRGR